MRRYLHSRREEREDGTVELFEITRGVILFGIHIRLHSVKLTREDLMAIHLEVKPWKDSE